VGNNSAKDSEVKRRTEPQSLFLFFLISAFYPISFIGCPQQTSVPPPTLVTVTSFPQMLQRYFSPIFFTPIAPPPLLGGVLHRFLYGLGK
jgi:hypothetical protein